MKTHEKWQSVTEKCDSESVSEQAIKATVIYGSVQSESAIFSFEV